MDSMKAGHKGSTTNGYGSYGHIIYGNITPSKFFASHLFFSVCLDDSETMLSFSIPVR